MIVSQELKWLYKELWAWRAFGLLILILFSSFETLKWLDESNHFKVTESYQASALEKRDREISLLNKNWSGVEKVDSNIMKVNENIYGCLRCHAHPPALLKAWNETKSVVPPQSLQSPQSLHAQRK
jgi:hypothetical protein